ncbi:NUDIX domain-containing protein [Streptomyces sp. NPDC004539]|uniref:NUDIX hydrolase n=1 Tax=Streptomyces sp. NPDC004539 TaxID=3154280 RepID=UPI0033A87F5E
MIERVRALLPTPSRALLLIRRTRPGVPVYWVTPGGKVEPTDVTHEDALRRELREEIAGVADSLRLLWTLDEGESRNYFYLAPITTWSFEDRSGPEFSAPGTGEYHLDEIPLTHEALDAVNLRPVGLRRLLHGALEDGVFG